MIRAHGSNGDREVMILGLSDLNVERLKAGQPIMVEMDDVGFPRLDLLILHGESEEDIRQDLKIVTRGQSPL